MRRRRRRRKDNRRRIPWGRHILTLCVAVLLVGSGVYLLAGTIGSGSLAERRESRAEARENSADLSEISTDLSENNTVVSETSTDGSETSTVVSENSTDESENSTDESKRRVSRREKRANRQTSNHRNARVDSDDEENGAALASSEAESAPESKDLEEIWADDPREAVEVRGLYLTAEAAASSTRRDDVIEMLDETAINAVVIDIKDDAGNLKVNLNIPLAEEIGANERLAFQTEEDLKEVLATLREHGAYLIARIPAFRDSVLAQAEPDCSLKWKEEYGGGIYCDNQGYYWLDPSNETVRQYLLDISLAAVDLGFDEIQFDYIRFPTTYIGRVDYWGDIGYYEADGVTYNEFGASLRQGAITSFVEYICRELVPEGVFVSADVYGTILLSAEDSGNVGQDYAALSAWLDYICPMVYPSHYDNGAYDILHPDTEPYTIVSGAMADSVERLNGLTSSGEHCATVRPWMQAFTANWLTDYLEYGGEELLDQINAVYDSGYSEWLLWQAGGNYEAVRSGIPDN